MNDAIEVICAGIVVVDHVAAPIDHLPGAGQLVLTDECFLTIGGCASNVAVDLARMGVRSNLCGCVGDDSFGRFAREVLEASGVATSGLVVAEQTATSQTLILNVKGQDRRFIHHIGANRVFSADHFPLAQIREAKVLYVGGYFLMDGLLPAELAEVFRAARSAGVRTVLDVVTPGPGHYLEKLQPVLPHTDVFLPNRDEAELITGRRDPLEQAQVFRNLGVGTAVITSGHEGSLLLSDSERLRAGVFPVEFVDGTGGGDAFDAGYVCGLLEGADARRCLELGSALGASCVRKSGATAGVFNRDEAEEFLKRHRLSIETI